MSDSTINSRRLRWKCRGRIAGPAPNPNPAVAAAARPLIMGILNVTPDSFSDGGRCFGRENAVARGVEMAMEGADIIDVGGESTRPGSGGVGADEELRRVVPVVEEIAGRTGVLVSIDTTKARVARAALEAGAHIVNDVSALTHDREMADVVREHEAGVILMHMLGTPRTMQLDPRYEDVVREVEAFLLGRVEDLAGRGIARESMALDPGIGFGKTLEHNLDLLARLNALARHGLPVVVGVSRKSFLGKLTGRPVEQRLASSLAAAVFCALRGADVLRAHDVRDTIDAVKVAAALAGRADVAEAVNG